MSYNDLRKGRISLPGMEYLVTTVCRERIPFFRQSREALILQSELELLETDSAVEWLAWVIMPDHFHGLVRLTDDASLSSTMKKLKGRSARALGRPVWQKGFHDHALRHHECRRAAARYVIANPVRAGLVDSLRDYPYWYCRWVNDGDNPDDFLVL